MSAKAATFWAKHTPFCRYCRVRLTAETRTIDHIWPRAKWPGNAKRGANCVANLAPCCTLCQRLKRADVLPGLSFDAHGGLRIDWTMVRFSMASRRAASLKRVPAYRADVEDLVKPRREGR